MLKQNISFTYLPGASGPSFVFLLFLGTKTINETGHYYPHILSTSMQISILSTRYCFHMNNIPNSTNKKKQASPVSFSILINNFQHKPVPGLAPFGCSSLAVLGHMTTKLQSSMLA